MNGLKKKKEFLDALHASVLEQQPVKALRESRGRIIHRLSREVSLILTKSSRHKMNDDDNGWKTLLDGLEKLGLLVDDSPKWCARGHCTQHRIQKEKSGDRPNESKVGVQIILQDIAVFYGDEEPEDNFVHYVEGSLACPLCGHFEKV